MTDSDKAAQANNSESVANALVDSPCIRHCTLDQADICVGCYRSLDEILAWNKSTNEQRLAILERAKLRSNRAKD